MRFQFLSQRFLTILSRLLVLGALALFRSHRYATLALTMIVVGGALSVIAFFWKRKKPLA